MSEKIPKEIPKVPEPKKVKKIRKNKKWVEVEVQDEKKKGPFRYIKFVDEDGLETWWMAVE